MCMPCKKYTYVLKRFNHPDFTLITLFWPFGMSLLKSCTQDGAGEGVALTTAKWQRIHHLLFTVVLPTVFEWCALSDFFLPDDWFYKKNSRGERSGQAYSVAREVCSEWFALVYRRVHAHPLRADYDVRLLDNDSGGIMVDSQPMLHMWKTNAHLEYLEHGGESLAEAYERGVELVVTQTHMELYEKSGRFKRCEELFLLFENSRDYRTPLKKCRHTIRLRDVQIFGHSWEAPRMTKDGTLSLLPSNFCAKMEGNVGLEASTIYVQPRRNVIEWHTVDWVSFPGHTYYHYCAYY